MQYRISEFIVNLVYEIKLDYIKGSLFISVLNSMTQTNR